MKHSLQLGIRGKLLWMFALLIILPLSTLGLVSYSNTQIMETMVFMGTKEALSAQSPDLARQFASFEAALEKLAASPDVRIDKIKPGVVWDKYPNLPAVNRPEFNQYFVDYFSKVAHQHDFVEHVFLATDEGAYYIAPIAPHENFSIFNPKEEGWYRQAVEKKQTVWSFPRFDVSSGMNTITVARPVLDEQGNMLGVVGFDVNLRAMAIAARQGIATNTLMITAAAILVGMAAALLFTTRLTRRIKQMQAGLEQVAAGDYTAELNVTGRDEMAEVSDSFNHMVHSVRGLLAQLQKAVAQLHESSDQVTHHTRLNVQQMEEGVRAVNEIANGAAMQAEQIEKSVALVGDVKEMTDVMTASIAQMREVSMRAHGASETGLVQMQEMDHTVGECERAVTQVVGTIRSLQQKSLRVSDMIGLINHIASQTNLLALNAAIEAARAGEHGRGFAVVADEVRKLAEQSRHSTEEITALLQDISADIDLSVETMNGMQGAIEHQTHAFGRVQAQFREITAFVNKIQAQTQQLAAFMEQIDLKQSEMVGSMESIANVSQQTAASAEEVAATTDERLKSFAVLEAAAQQLRDAAERLDRELQKFTV
ncbi:methyl-accepting chemotaxis protein [Brevibacillus sp. SYP-B805]|uniref:methyl-accepting chemotaxis protein n=1 Tax=Brevibacillus sp. SYP-B805 TaxID=1578199 RepID=UPI0013EDD8E6|nr:methyl-accepting chemotaxis protein [Brevibacillus sp. SYP-B805]NGQ96993.1 methyl-accepting chemotaxis protein [Brevibacillus sp. SYP-B805]